MLFLEIYFHLENFSVAWTNISIFLSVQVRG